MRKLRPLDLKLLLELMKNAKRSDRELAKVLGVSQPTITRTRAWLEKELIDGYTAVPKWGKIGYEILAITLVKTRSEAASRQKYEIFHRKGLDWLLKQPNILMAGGCRGAEFNAFNISLHKNYSDYDEFMYNFRLEWGQAIDNIQSILVNLVGRELLKPLNFKYLTEAKAE